MGSSQPFHPSFREVDIIDNMPEAPDREECARMTLVSFADGNSGMLFKHNSSPGFLMVS